MNQLQHPRATPVPSHTASTSSVSTASTVIHRPAAAAMDDVTPEVSTDPNPTPARPAAAKAGLFRGRDGGSNFRAPPENRNLPTSNFLINRHKLLRKTEEGKMLHEGGTLSGTRPYLRSSSQNLAPAGSTSPAAAVAAAVDLVAQSSEAKNAHGEHKVSTVTMNMDGMRGAGGHGGHGGGAGGGHGGGGGGAENNSYRTTGNYVNERPSSRAAGESLSMVTTTSTENRSSRANLSGGGLPGSGMPADNQPIPSTTDQQNRQISSVRWSPTPTPTPTPTPINSSGSSRPQVPPKPAIFSPSSSSDSRVVTSSTQDKADDTASQKGRSILRVPSLRRSLTRSRTPSQDRHGEDQKTPKKKEEFLHENVVYTKTKTDPPISGNRQHLLRATGKLSNITTTSKMEVSQPQFVNTTADQFGSSSVQLRDIRDIRTPSPAAAAQRPPDVLPVPVHTTTGRGNTVAVERERVDVTPIPIVVETPIAPVYARLSDTRLAALKTTRSENAQPVPLPALVAPSPAPSGFIQPQIRPMPPRKPARMEITESLLEVLPQKAKRQAPAPPPTPVTAHGIRQQQTPLPLQTNRSDLVVSGANRTTTDGGINRGASRSSTVINNSHTHYSHNNNSVAHHNVPIKRVVSPERPVSHLRTVDSLSRRGKSPDGSSYAGHMTFDDEFDSVMSSSHVDYEHSSADEADDLVKRSLVKASNRRAPIEDIAEENMTATAYVEVAPSVSSRANLQPEYDRLPQRPLRQVITRKSSFLSSADDSDSSRGHPVGPVQQQQRSSGMTTHISRKDAENLANTTAVSVSDPRQLSGTTGPASGRDDSAGRRKYEERRQLLRNFENGLHRRRIDSSKTSSSIDSDTMDRDDRFTQQQQQQNRGNYNKKMAPQPNYVYQRTTGQTPLQSSSRSRYADHESDDGAASDSVGIPEPLPEYEYPSRVQGRTIKEVQEIRESVRLRDNSSSTSSERGGRSPSRNAGTSSRDHHFSRHFDISAEELNTARSLIHHRLPPTSSYPEPPPAQQPVMRSSGSRLSLLDRSRTPPPSRSIFGGGYSRPDSQSPDGRMRPGGARLPPQGPQIVRGPLPNVHHSDGETRYFAEKKPKKKLGIVRRLSELVRGERKPKQRDVQRKSSTSSMEQEQDNRAPVMAAGVRSRRLSPIRRYQDQPLRPVVHNPAGSQAVSRVPSFNRPIPNPRDNVNRHSGNFSDTGTASFVYQDQLGPPGPVYAQPNKLQKQQSSNNNIGRYRSMSEYDMDRVGTSGRGLQHEIQYVNKPINPSKSVESISESVWRQLRGPTRKFDHSSNPPDEKLFRVTKTTLVPWGKKKDNAIQPAVVRVAKNGIYDRNATLYSSSPAIPSMNQVDYRMGPPVKPPRRLDYDSAARSTSDSDPSTRFDDRRGLRDVRTPVRQPLERSRPESDLHLVAHRQPAQYSEPERRGGGAASISSGGEDTVPRTNRFQSSIYTDTRPRQIDVVVHNPPEQQQQRAAPQYARTRIAANDYANRRYHSAAADVNRVPEPQPIRRLASRDPSEERRYKSSYKMLIDNPSPSRGGGSVVQERSRFFNNPPPRREVAVRR